MKKRHNLKNYQMAVELILKGITDTISFSTFAKDDDEAMRIARTNYPTATHIEILN